MNKTLDLILLIINDDELMMSIIMNELMSFWAESHHERGLMCKTLDITVDDAFSWPKMVDWLLYIRRN
jgi:hypothetical protein